MGVGLTSVQITRYKVLFLREKICLPITKIPQSRYGNILQYIVVFMYAVCLDEYIAMYKSAKLDYMFHLASPFLGIHGVNPPDHVTTLKARNEHLYHRRWNCPSRSSRWCEKQHYAHDAHDAHDAHGTLPTSC